MENGRSSIGLERAKTCCVYRDVLRDIFMTSDAVNESYNWKVGLN